MECYWQSQVSPPPHLSREEFLGANPFAAPCSAAVIGSVKTVLISPLLPFHGYPNLSESMKPLGKGSNKGCLTRYEDGMTLYNYPNPMYSYYTYPGQ